MRIVIQHVGERGCAGWKSRPTGQNGLLLAEDSTLGPRRSYDMLTSARTFRGMKPLCAKGLETPAENPIPWRVSTTVRRRKPYSDLRSSSRLPLFSNRSSNRQLGFGGRVCVRLPPFSYHRRTMASNAECPGYGNNTHLGVA